MLTVKKRNFASLLKINWNLINFFFFKFYKFLHIKWPKCYRQKEKKFTKTNHTSETKKSFKKKMFNENIATVHKVIWLSFCWCWIFAQKLNEKKNNNFVIKKTLLIIKRSVKVFLINWNDICTMAYLDFFGNQEVFF